jgi:DNA ligase-1
MTTKSAPELLLAKTWNPGMDPTGYWMSEKLDGVRAWWTGSKFLSRLGNEFFAPDWFKKGLPKEPLDGELWMGRGNFQLLVGTVKRHVPNENWSKVKYVVFDAPCLNRPFEDRIDELVPLLQKSQWAEELDHIGCTSEGHLQDRLASVIAHGGEGLMLREPESLYEAGRSTTLLKVKQFLDASALVVGHQPGKGKHKGRLGALICLFPDGTQFDIGTGFTDAERENPPAIGSTVTVKFQELTKDGCPRFPSYVSERHVS